MLGDPNFGPQIRECGIRFRENNAIVIFATGYSRFKLDFAGQ